MQIQRCAKCGQSMEEGYLMDSTSRGVVRQLRWGEGAPKRFLGMMLKTWGRRQLPVSASRCSNCGYLELYAAEQNQ